MLHYRNGFALIILPLLVAIGSAEAQQTGRCPSPLAEAYLDVNNVRARIFNNGNLFWRGSPSVYEVPKGGGASSVFNSGIWIGGMVGGQLRAAAARYGNYQYWAGPLDDSGEPPEDCAVFDRLYKVNRADVDDYEATGTATPDLRDWPTGLGAPTYAVPNNGLDDDGDGETDEEFETIAIVDQPLASRIDRKVDLAGGERPAILGDQSIWWIMNDRGNLHNAPGADTPPVGLEVHVMAFAFNASGPIGNSTFFKYDVYYKGREPLTDAYMGVYSDPDLGNFQDDWVGSDTTRGIGYVWNSDDDDEGGSGYGTPAPALGYDFFQGPIVPSVGDTAQVSGVKIPDFKNLKMSHFVYYNNGGCIICDPLNGEDYYNYMRGRWKDGQPMTEGGNGRDFSLTPVKFMYPGEVGESQESCEYWSECNVDGTGTANVAADRRFVMSTGPFTINPGDYQQIVFGIVWARGDNNYDSVRKMKLADELAQAAFDVNFFIPFPPDAPMLTVTPADRSVILEWSNSPRSNNYLETYSAQDPFAEGDDREYVFEGYDVIQYDNALDDVGTVIATFDVKNGIRRVIDGFPGEPTEVTATGNDGGVRNSYTVSGLTNYKTYHFAVQAYAYNEASFPKVYRGPATRTSVIPTKPTKDVSEAAEALLGNDEVDFVGQGAASLGDGQFYGNVANPVRMTDAEYSVQFYEHEFGKRMDGLNVISEGDVVDPLGPKALSKVESQASVAITYDISRDGEVLFSGRSLAYPAPLRTSVFSADGLSFDVLGPAAGFKDFMVTANAAGPLDPPDYAGWGWAGFPDPRGLSAGDDKRQQVAGGVWGYHAGGAGQAYGPVEDGSSFLGRAMRDGLLFPYLGSYDYEQRFTQECADGVDGNIDLANDCLAIRAYGDLQIMEVPFSLWRTGVNTPDDMTDDVQMIPYLCEEACGAGTELGVYDIGGDHAFSSGENDPHTDWIYWNLPLNDAPGSDGYHEYFAEDPVPEDIVYDLYQIIARSVLGSWNGGTAAPYERPLPEIGTVFRIVTNKQNQAGDAYAFSTAGYGAKQPTGDRARDRLKHIGIVPNPYKGASDYEVSQLTNEVRFTNLPDVATIRVFTLNGTLLKTINKNSPGIATITWDMVTEYNLPIASGLYLVHVSVPDVGETVLKFGVVKKRIQLNTY